MKRVAFLVFLLLVARCLPLVADQIAEAAALAAQKDAEERYKRLSADIQTVLDNQEVLQKRQEDFRQKLDRLADDVRNLKDEQSRNSGNLVTRDELRKYVEKLKELDEKREADKKLILENIKELSKLPAAPTPEPKTASRQKKDTKETKEPKEAADSPSTDDLPYSYTVKKNDRLLDIIGAYNEHFQKHGQGKITKDQVLKANPGLKPDRLIAGSKIRIPVPASKDGGK